MINEKPLLGRVDIQVGPRVLATNLAQQGSFTKVNGTAVPPPAWGVTTNGGISYLTGDGGLAVNSGMIYSNLINAPGAPLGTLFAIRATVTNPNTVARTIRLAIHDGRNYPAHQTFTIPANSTREISAPAARPMVAPGSPRWYVYDAAGAVPLIVRKLIMAKVDALGDEAPPYFSGGTANDENNTYSYIGDAGRSHSEHVGYQSLTEHATALTIRRGGSRSGLGIKTDVGLMNFRLFNDQDPLDGGTLRPGQSLRAMVDGSPIFTGRIAEMDAVYPLNKNTGEQRAFTSVTVADAVKVHATTPRYGAMIGAPFYETFEARIARLATSALAPIDAPAPGAPREVYSF